MRELLNSKPWIGWAVAGALLVLAIVLYITRSGGGGDPESPERMQEVVVIKFTDTGDELEMPRGRMEKQLRERGGTLDTDAGITNPKTGKPTGFPFKRNEWEETIKRINKDKEVYNKPGQNPAVKPAAPAPAVPVPAPAGPPTGK